MSFIKDLACPLLTPACMLLFSRIAFVEWLFKNVKNILDAHQRKNKFRLSSTCGNKKIAFYLRPVAGVRLLSSLCRWLSGIKA